VGAAPAAGLENSIFSLAHVGGGLVSMGWVTIYHLTTAQSLLCLVGTALRKGARLRPV
jgi:hypothetical protein